MKKIASMAAVCVAVVASAQGTVSGVASTLRSGGEDKSLEKALADPVRHPLQIKKRAKLWQDGGLVQAPTTGKVVRVVNEQGVVPAASVKEVADMVPIVLRVPVEVVAPPQDVSCRAADPMAPVVLRIVSKPDAPRILVAPEDRWAQLNVTALGSDGASPDVVKVRLAKEFWRCLAYMLGAANSQMQPCLMRGVSSLADIDAIEVRVPSPEPFRKMLTTVRELGFTPAKMVLYRTAVKEGWAPAPTNETQRKIKSDPNVEIALPEALKKALDTVLAHEREMRERGPTNPILILPPNQKK